MSDDMFYCSFVSIHYIICECGETFPTEEELKIHLEKEHAQKKEKKEYKCGICDALFNTEEACIEHYENTHIEVKTEDPEDAEGMVYEDVKDDTIIQIQEILEGDELSGEVTVKTEVTQRKKERKPKSYYNMKNIVCEVCGKRYASNAALRYHQRVHTGERPYHCTLCTKSFTMPLFLQIHMRTHTGERPYECPHCPKAFSNKAALLRHDRVHTGVKPYECPECGKFFTQSNSMKLHVNTVHLKMPAPYKSKSRRIKAKEREMMRKALLMNSPQTSEDSAAVESIKREPELVEAELTTLHYVKPEVTLYQQEAVKTEELYEQEVDESEIMYVDVDSREVTYEVVYEE